MAMKTDYAAQGGVQTVGGNWVWRDANGQKHREDGPAVIGARGHREWWFCGQRHREDGPAVKWSNGSQEWYLHGDLHRADGPAVISSHGLKAWYVHGRNITREVDNWMESNRITWPFTPEQRIEFLMRWS